MLYVLQVTVSTRSYLFSSLYLIYFYIITLISSSLLIRVIIVLSFQTILQNL